jgi:hypothetical protein
MKPGAARAAAAFCAEDTGYVLPDALDRIQHCHKKVFAELAAWAHHFIVW